MFGKNVSWHLRGWRFRRDPLRCKQCGHDLQPLCQGWDIGRWFFCHNWQHWPQRGELDMPQAWLDDCVQKMECPGCSAAFIVGPREFFLALKVMIRGRDVLSQKKPRGSTGPLPTQRETGDIKFREAVNRLVLRTVCFILDDTVHYKDKRRGECEPAARLIRQRINAYEKTAVPAMRTWLREVFLARMAELDVSGVWDTSQLWPYEHVAEMLEAHGVTEDDDELAAQVQALRVQAKRLRAADAKPSGDTTVGI